MLIEKSIYIPSERQDMLAFINNNPKTMLEVGCREGLFTHLVKKHYDIQDSWGIEPDETVIEIAQNNIHHVVHDFFTKETELPEHYFDLIAFNDVLEHMYDPWDALLKAKTLLSKNGRVIVSLPNIRYKKLLKNLFLHDDFTYQRNGILDATHIRFFTKTTMIKMFEDTGYFIEIVKPVLLPKKRRFYKKIVHFPRKLVNLMTNDRFTSLQYTQYAFTLRVAK